MKTSYISPYGGFTLMKYWEKIGNHILRIKSIKDILFFGTFRPSKSLEYLIKLEQIIRKWMKNYNINIGRSVRTLINIRITFKMAIKLMQ